MQTRPEMLIPVLVALVGVLRRSAGRLAPRVAIAPLVFLITRWPVLIAWVVGTIGMAVVLVRSAAANGHDATSDVLTLCAISLFSGGGVAVLTVGPVFFLARAFTTPPALPLGDGESIVREVTANHFLRGESRGGKLLVTNERLAFRPNRFNVQLATWSLPLTQIRSLSVEGERFVVVGTDAGAEWLVTMAPHKLVETIRQAALGQPGAMVNP